MAALRRGQDAAAALSVVAAFTALASSVAITLATTSPPADRGYELLSSTLFEFAFAIFTVVGAVLVFRRAGGAVGWMFIGAGLHEAAVWVLDATALHAQPDFDAARTSTVGALAERLGWASPAWGMLILLLFPTGRALSNRWRTFVIVVAIWGFGVTVMEPLALLTAPLFAASATGIVARYRRSRGIERLQMKWIVSAAALTALWFIANVVVGVVLGDRPRWLDSLVLPGIAGIPIAAGVAVTRYRLYDIDRIVSRTVSYSVLTAVLAAPYAVIVTAVTRVASSDLAVALATLAAAALFQPLRRRVQGAVDRRFNRAKYDAARIVESFRDRLRDEVVIDALRGDLLRAVASTVQPARASLWLRAGPGSS